MLPRAQQVPKKALRNQNSVSSALAWQSFPSSLSTLPLPSNRCRALASVQMKPLYQCTENATQPVVRSTEEKEEKEERELPATMVPINRQVEPRLLTPASGTAQTNVSAGCRLASCSCGIATETHGQESTKLIVRYKLPRLPNNGVIKLQYAQRLVRTMTLE